MSDSTDPPLEGRTDADRRTTRNQLVVRWLTLLAVVGVVLLGSITAASLPVPPGTSLLGLTASQTRHLLAYAGLAVVLAPIVTGTAPSDRGVGRLALVVCLVIGFGAAVELVQAGLSHRAGTVADVGVNAVGAALGLAGVEVLVTGVELLARVRDGFR
ncbi:VanZ family protein [Halovivax cerinus]|uniref:VanZ family protein n=1 Tax=Halovivax cerinus TaxID=1487865 RepID=A0ABD5NNQ1_9EURY|nr:VanZ family protein [Halovivax cerinus]